MNKETLLLPANQKSLFILQNTVELRNLQALGKILEVTNGIISKNYDFVFTIFLKNEADLNRGEVGKPVSEKTKVVSKPIFFFSSVKPKKVNLCFSIMQIQNFFQVILSRSLSLSVPHFLSLFP